MSPQKSTDILDPAVPAQAPEVAAFTTDDSAEAPLYRKPRADLYTVLLVLALLAVLIGILFLYLEMETYDFKFKGGPSVTMVTDHARSLLATLIPNL